MEPPQQATLSFVIPMLNEEDCLAATYERVRGVAEAMGMQWEIVCVDDGSTDSTLEGLRAIHAREPRLKVVSLSRNFGHQIAVAAGLRYASGDGVVVMDADLQDPPEVVERMVEAWREGYHVVYGIRRRRKDGWLKRACYAAFYRLQQRTSLLPIPLDAGDFALMDRRVVDLLREFPEADPFIRGLRAWVGFKQTGIEYDRQSRAAGEPKYGYIQLCRLALDGLLSFSCSFLRLSTWLGLIVASLSLFCGVYIAISRVLAAAGAMDSGASAPGWAAVVCGLLFLMGLQFIVMGILGEYIGRTFIQTKHRPLFIVQEEVGFKGG